MKDGDAAFDAAYDGPPPQGILRSLRLGGVMQANDAALRAHAKAADRAADQARTRHDPQGLVAARLAGLRVLDRLRGSPRG